MRWPAALRWAIVTGSLLCLGGCASVAGLFGYGKDGSGKLLPRAVAPAYQLEIDAPSDLRKLLVTYLDLSRFQSAPESEAITRAELDRMVAAAPAQARELLQTEGYFNAVVKVTRVEKVPSAPAPTPASGTAPAASAAASTESVADEVDRDAPLPRTNIPLLRVVVDPGPRAIVQRFSFEARGPLKDAADAKELDARVLIAQVRNQWQLPPELPFRQSTWGTAKTGALAKLRADGYLAAVLNPTSATVDADTNTVAIEVTAESGPLYRIGPISVTGLRRYDEDAVLKLSNLKPGAPYRESLLVDYQERLQKAGLFEGAAVVLDPDPETADAATVNVRVRELPLQQATLGAGYSGNNGPRLTLEHFHRQPFGWRWIAKNKFELGPKLKSWSGELTSYPLDNLYRNLLAASAEELKSVNETRRSLTARVGRRQDSPRIERLIYAELTQSRLETTSDSGTTFTDSRALSANYHWTYRDIDSVLLPTDGYTLALQGAGGFATSGTDSNGLFGRAYARYTLYTPLGASWYSIVRAEAGQVEANNAVGIPDTLLFRAGGDDSVRGYEYRSLGPKVDGALLSGTVLFTASAEIARPILKSRPDLWWAAFLDAGNAANRWQDLQPALGYGVGLRWRSPVGPLRFDLAYGQEVQSFRTHLSVAIAF